MNRRAVLPCAILLQLIAAVAVSQPVLTPQPSSFCRGTEVVFDSSAVDALYNHPGEIICNVDSFWTANAAYRLAGQFSENNRLPLNREEWAERVRTIDAMSDEERRREPAVQATAGIIGLAGVLRDKGIPHLSSFLPSTAPPLKVTIYLISDIKPAAFACPGGILVNVNSPRFNCDSSVIMNILVHEIYHGGFAGTVAGRSDSRPQNDALDFVLDFLLNEGMATYVSYSARHIFPNDFVPDYRMMENIEDVKANLEKVDQLFRKAETMPIDSIMNLAWQTGVIERAFYVAGGYMAYFIDRTMGREALVNAMSAGPISFTSLYNSVSDEGMRIRIPQMP